MSSDVDAIAVLRDALPLPLAACTLLAALRRYGVGSAASQCVLDGGESDDVVAETKDLDAAFEAIGDSRWGGGVDYELGDIRYSLFVHCLRPGLADAVVISRAASASPVQGGSSALQLLLELSSELKFVGVHEGVDLIEPSSAWREYVNRFRAPSRAGLGPFSGHS